MGAIRSPRGDSVGGKGESVGGRSSVSALRFSRQPRLRLGRRCRLARRIRRRHRRPSHPGRDHDRRDDSADGATDAPEPTASYRRACSGSEGARPPPDATAPGGAAESATPAAHRSRPRRAPSRRRARLTEHANTEHAGRQRAGGGTRTRGQARAGSPDLNARRSGRTARSSTCATRPDAAPSAASTQVTFQLPGADRRTAAVGHRSGELRRRNRATAHIVSLKEPAAAAPISLLPADEAAAEAVRAIRASGVPGKPLVQRTCTRPTARVPLSQRCKQARVISALRVRLISCPARRCGQPSTGSRPGEDPECRSPSAPGVEGRQEAPGGEGHDQRPVRQLGPGDRQPQLQPLDRSDLSSRVLVLAAPPLSVPRPFRFARLRLPSTIPHGVIARSSPCSTRVAPRHDSSTRRPGKILGLAVSRVNRGQMSFGRTQWRIDEARISTDHEERR